MIAVTCDIQHEFGNLLHPRNSESICAARFADHPRLLGCTNERCQEESEPEIVSANGKIDLVDACGLGSCMQNVGNRWNVIGLSYSLQVVEEAAEHEWQ